MKRDIFEALLATLEFKKPVFKPTRTRLERADRILIVGNVIKMTSGRIVLVGHVCEMGGVGQNLTITDPDKIEGVAHISQLFKETE